MKRDLREKKIAGRVRGLIIMLSIIMAFVVSNSANAQLVVTEANTTAEVESFIEDVLLGSCVTVSNFSYTGPANATGTFDGTTSNLGMGAGIIMTTGEAGIAVGPDNNNGAGANQGNVGDADLDLLVPAATFDATILEFDFIPQDDTLRFNYIFGSEEYPEYVNGGFNDVFGFFISGPGYNGPYSNNAENIALIPGTTTPVAIDNLNNGFSNTEPATGPCTNCAYYVENGGGATVQYDAFTTTLTAVAVVQACQTYHIKMAIGDAGDHVFDSGVFIQERSFSAGGGVSVEIETSNIPPGIYEGCADAWFVFRRLDVINNGSPITAGYTISGTATPGVDYSAIPNSITIPAGEDSILVNIQAFFDGVPEGTETIILTLDDPPCSCMAPEAAVVDILDNDIPLTVTTTGSTTICVGQSANLTASPTGSQTPYLQSWDNGLGSGLNQTVSPTTTTTYTFTVSDACGGQTATSSETVVVIEGDFSIDDDQQCFSGNNFSFTNTGTSNGTVTHFWDFGDGSGTSTQENPTYSYSAAGNYTVTHNVIYTATTCTTVVTASVDVWDMPIVSTTSTDVVCTGDATGVATAIVTGGTSAFGYAWSPGGMNTATITNLTEGTYNVTVTDAHNCVGTSSATIGQNDPIPPTAICQNIIVQLDATGNVGISATQIDNGSSDNCGIASMVVYPNSFTCAEVGNNTVTLTVTDPSGNQSICNATVTVQDNIAPTALCQNLTVQLDATGNVSITAAQIDNGSTDNCAIQSITVNPSAFDCTNVGANTVTLTVTDVNSNISTCTATVTVEDNEDPIINCNNITVQLDASGNATIVLSDIDGGASDNCGIASSVLSPSSFTCANVGANTVTVTVTDNSGNVTVCTSTVTVEDVIPPTLLCNNATLNLDASGNATVVLSDLDGGSTSDNCAIASSTITPSNFDCSNVGPNSVTVTVFDSNGNSSTCNAVVTIVDNISPTALCQNVTVQLDASGNVSVSSAQVDNGSSDNCGIQSMTVSPSTFDCSNVGANTVTLTVTDVNGNVATCTSTVTVEDNVNPTAACQNITVDLDASGNATIVAADVDNGSSDNCGIQTMTVNPSSFTCANVGLNVVTLTVTDVNGNVATCTSNVNVQDNISPTVICNSITVFTDATGNVTITAADVDGGSFDNCALASLSVVPTSFDCNSLGANTVTLTATDFSGNVSSCTATVTVEDNLPPTAICQNITAYLDPLGNVTIAAGDIDNGSTDPCGLQSITVVPSTFTCADIGPNVVTLTVTDISGNVSTCTAVVDVVDEVIPIANCQNITVFLDATGNVVIQPEDIDDGSSDACGSVSAITVVPNTFDCNDQGGNAVTLTVEDSNGNQAICVATVTVVDPIPPTAYCQDITVQLNALGQASITPAQIDNGSLDNCAIVSYSVTPNQFNCTHVGANTVTLTVSDDAGNSSTCTATVTVEDNVAPTAICQDITVQLDAAGNVSITAAQINNGSVDNCGIQSMSVTPNTFTCAGVGANAVTLTVTDLSGNVSTCSSTVTVQDNVNPNAICQDISVQLDATGNVTINSTQIDNGSSDACGIASMTLNNDAFDCSNIGPNTVIMTVTDVNGNVSTCTSTVTVQEDMPPTAICQNITVQLDAAGNVTVAAISVDNGSFDNCSTGGALSFSLAPATFSCADVGLVTATLTVTDAAGNSSTCITSITVEDNVPPIAICQDITIQLDAVGNASITSAQIDNGSFDNCGIANMNVNPNTFTCAAVGANPVTLTVTDDYGNVSTCSATVTVQDNVDPVAICQNITVQLDASGNASITASQIDNGSADACGIASLVIDNSTFNCSNVGANTVTLTVTDVNGNVSTCVSTVTVEDNVDPTATCQNITVQLDASGNASITAAQIDNGSADACGIASINVSPSTFNCTNVGANAVTLTVTDNNGNVSICTASVTVEDNVAPTALCQNITVQLDAAGNANITAAQIDNGSNDACGILNMTVTPANFNCSNVGGNTVTLTVNDINGNTSTCTATVTVEDNVAPVAICQDVTIQLDALGNATLATNQIDNGSSDACGIASMTVSPSTFTCADEGANTVTLTVTDNNGNSSTCTATVTVENNVVPNVSCQDITVQLDATGNVSIIANDVNGGSDASCGLASLTVTPSTFNCSNIGANTVILTATDNSGNVSTCTATVTVEDNVAPAALCQNLTIQLDGSGNASITAAQIDNGSSDNCAIAAMSVSPSAFTCAEVGANTVTLTVTDVNGNVSTCTSTVTVQDNINPTASCQNLTVQLDATGNISITAAQINNGSSDNCAIASMSVTPSTFDCSNVGGNTVTLTVTDVNGNSATCSATVTVDDNEAPTANCQNITIQLDASGNASITAAQINNGSSDNCGIASMSVTPSSFTCAGVGTNPVTLTVTDVNGNVSTCSATVTVEDNVDPTAICQDLTVQLDGLGLASITATQIDNGSFDNCGIATMTLNTTSFNCSNVGPNTVIMTVTDVNGNVSTCVSTVTVEDNVNPIAQCQDITIQLDATGAATISASDVDNSSSDNCGISSMVVSPSSFTCAEEGANTVILTVTDVNGNVNTCTSTVTVENNVVPVVGCQDITVQLDATGNVSITANDVSSGANASCGLASLTISPSTFNCSNVGPNTVTLTATDNSGNVSTCTAVVTVEDNIAPTPLCQSITVQLDASGNASITAAQIDNGSSDNCGIQSMTVSPSTFGCTEVGANTVTLTVTDVNGNVSTCTATVTVEDNVAPTVICQNITLELDATGNVVITPVMVDNGSSDNCSTPLSGLTYDINPTGFDCSNVGVTTATLTVTDENGNSSSCTASITIQDNEAPIAVCQDITIQLDATGNASITAAQIDNGSSDNCGIASMTVTPSTFTCSGVGANPVTLTVTDVNGNVSTCSATVTVEDNVSPTAICQDITVQLDATGNVSITASQIDNGSFDNCGIATMTVSPSSFTCAEEGANAVTLTVTDVNGNVSTCASTVTVENNVAPVISCQDITIQLDTTGNASIVAADVNAGTNASCGLASLTVSPSTFDCSNVGANTVTLTATDNSGNVSTCNATVTVEDNVDPTALCQSITVQLDATGNASITAAQIDNGSSDNCAIFSMTANPTTFGCSDVGANTVTLTVTDVNGNVSTCTSTVTVEDNVAPIAICQDITVQLNASGNVSITAAQIDNGSSDNCGIATMTVSPSSFTCTEEGANAVTLTVTDVNGNVSTCASTVTVQDNITPTAICQDITVQLDATGNASITAAQIDNASFDNCGIASMSVSPSAFTCAEEGANTVTLTVTDVNGNVSTCTSTVTVENNVVPTMSCQDITVYLDGTGNIAILADDVNAGSNASCGIASLVVSPSTFDCSNIGANTVTLTGTDNSGNVSICTATVTVLDTVNPTVICQDITVDLDLTGNYTVLPSQIDNGSNDACGILNMELTPDKFSCEHEGANAVTLIVTDVNGNIDSCQATVFVVNNVPPTVVCQNVTVYLDATGNISIISDDVNAGSNASCGLDTLIVTPSDFDCSNIGLNNVVLTATDSSGNSSTCSAIVTVLDTVLPIAICQDITVQLDATGNVSITAAQINNGSSDNCAIASMTVAPSTFECLNVGANPVVLTITDVNGNVSTCSSTVTVEDNVAPVAICQNITVQLDPSGNVTINAAQVDNGSDDACGIDFLTVTPNSFDCSNIGVNTVTLTATDNNGNTSTCTATVTVQDTEAPIALCQNITVQLDASGNASITAAQIDNGSFDNCAIASMTVTPSTFTCAGVGANPVTLTVTDVNGNVSTCSATVTVEDNVAPAAICQDLTVQLDGTGNASIVVSQIDNGSDDACGVASMTLSQLDFNCSHIGANTVIMTVTDNNGNVSTCQSTVTVEDNIAPQASCQDITVQLDPNGNATIIPPMINNGSTDNCTSQFSLDYQVSQSTFDCNDIGVVLVTLTVTDAQGNSSTCAASVTVMDQQPPMPICQDITIQLDANGNVSITAADIDNGTTDNCGIASMSPLPSVFDCSDVGQNNVLLLVMDVNGNSAVCGSVVTVEDNVPPVALCQDITVQLDALGTITIAASQVDNGSNDACGIASLSVSPSTFTCADEGANTVTLTVTDNNGNTSTCTSTVTVENNVAPNVSCQDITVYLDASGNTSIVPNDVNGGTDASCGIASITVTPDAFDCSNIGPNTVTLTATDNSGNVSTCTAVVTVVDTVSPTAICQNIIVQLDGTGNATIAAADVDNASSDACGIASLSVSPSTFTCAEVGANTVTLTVTDVNGNASTCSATVTVEDNVDPTIVCQSITVQLDANGNAVITAVELDGGSTDNCSTPLFGLTYSVDQTDFDCSNIGSNVITLTVTDADGNASTCSATVTVEDNVPPIAICQDITVQLDAFGNASIAAGDVDNGSTDNCGIASIDVAPSAFTCTEVGANTVTLTVTDVNGNVSTCTSTVTVEDNVVPEALCQNITVQLDANGDASITASQIDNGSNDACGIASLSVSPSTFDCSNIGINAVILTVTDNNGNVSICNAEVTVQDDVNPTVICQDITVQLDANGQITVAAIDIDGGSTDNCSSQGAGLTYDITPAIFDCSDVGVATAVLTVTDAYGNYSSCTASITVEDNDAPIAICQDITVQLDPTGNVSITAAQIDNGSSDNCGIASMNVSPSDFTCAGVGANPVTLTVTDVNGNVSTCSSTVTVEDNVAPIANCQDITVQLDATGNVSITATQVDNGSSDNCGIASMTVSPSAFTCAEEGANTVTLTVTDLNGNVSTCTSTVTVENNVTPNVFCQDISIYLDATGNVSIIADDVNGGSNAACGLASLVVSPDAFDCSNVGANTVTLTATDNSGNISTCNATVTVIDTVAPVVICQNITVQLDATGNVIIQSVDIDGGSTDNCGIASITVDGGAISTSFDCSNVGVNTVTLTVTDVNGNVSTCDASVTVEDNVAPVVICQDITVQLDATGNVTIQSVDIDGGSTDNCGIASITVNGGATDMSFDCSSVGANTVTLTVTDVNGNVSMCDATVTVEDNVDPITICQNITVQLDAAGNVTIQSVDIDGGSTDNCGIASITVNGGATDMSFDCSSVGANTVTLTVTDVNGNVSTCDATVTVEDNVAPVVICQDITIQLDATGNVIIQSVDIDGGSTDNCGIASITVNGGATDMSFDCSTVGTNTVTLTVTDVNGNVSMCDATVTVEDTVSPVVICQDITIQLDATGNVIIQSVDIDGGSTDNCGIASITVDGGATDMSFDCSNEGANTVTLTVTDVNGNVSTCDATVTVENNVTPNVLCQDISVYLDATGNVSIIADDVNGGSNAACGLASLVVSPDAFDCSNVGANTVTLTATDISGNISTCTATVTVIDTVAPVVICQDITIQLDATGNVIIQSVDIDGGSTDNCGIASIAVDGGATDMSFDCSSVGTNTVTLTVTDVNGNVSTCDATVTVEDTISPVVICQDITIQLDATGNVIIQSVDIDGGSTDNCGIASITVDGGSTDMSFDCSSVGANTVTLTVTDVNGNVSTCDATVTVEDTVAPVVICQDITIQLDASGNVIIQSVDIDGGSTDNCGIASITVNGGATDMSFDCSSVGANTVTLTVTDVNGNVSTCDATVTVEDTISPVVICQDITIQLDATGNVIIQSVDIDGGSTDNCGIASITVDSGATDMSFDCSTVGTNTVTLTVTDVNGNVSMCDATVTVQDTVAPVVICQDTTIQLDANGNVIIQSVDIDGGSTDNCGIASITVNGGATDMSFDCSTVGTNTVTLTVTDMNGNVSTCDATITVEDNVAPNVVCQDITIYLDANGNASITAADVDGGSNSACGVGSLSVSPSAFTCAGVGVNPVTLTAVDNNGNVATCQANVTVVDTVAPIAICQDITLQLDATGNASIIASQVDNGSNDACGVQSIDIDIAGFTCANIGANTVTLTVTDNNGNVTTCASTVTVEDNVPPVTLCQGVTIYMDSLGVATVSAYDLDNGSNDACGIDTILINQSVYDCGELGVNQGEITVIDVNGNSATCMADVNVMDTIAPYFVDCPTDVTVIPDSNNCEPFVMWTPPTGMDNCTPTVTSTHVPGDAFPVGTTTVTYTVTDESGNSNTCSFDVVIEPVQLLVSLSSTEFNCGTNISCNGMNDGVINTFVSGGCLPYTYAWSNGQTGETAIDLVAGTYDVTVTDVNGVEATASVAITEPTPVVISSIIQSDYNGSNISCWGAQDGTIDITVEGGADCLNYTYAWAGPNGVLPSTEDQTDLFRGIYYVEVTDANGCIYLDTILMTQPDSLHLETHAFEYEGGFNISCAGSEDGSIDLNITEGTAPYSVSWDNGDLTQDISGLSAGTYVATVTDANGCESTIEITLTEPQLMESSISSAQFIGGNNISCNGLEDGNIDLTVSGGNIPYSFIWSNGDLTEDLTNLAVGEYSVVVTDVNGCTKTDTIILTEPELLVLNSIDTNEVNCFGGNDGSFTVEATGGIPNYTYTWSNGSTGATATDLSTGFITAFVQDENGCSGSLQMFMSEPLELVAAIQSQLDVTCFEGTNGLIDVTVQGGTTPYTFAWDNGANTEDLNGVVAGTYTLTITDANLCETQLTATIDEPTLLIVAIDSTNDVSCFGSEDGQAWVSATGGTSPYTYAWTNGQQDSVAVGLSEGSHEVTVTDANGCSQVLSVEINAPAALFANLVNSSGTSCNGASDGSANVDVVGGTEPYSYLWSNADTTSSTTDFEGGNQFVIITDAHGCDTTINFIIDEPAALNVISALAADPTCFGDSSGVIQISISGGTEPYYPVWEDGQTTLLADGFGAGDHTVVVEDINGCVDSLTVTLGQPTLLEVTQQVITDPTCNGNDDGQATVIVQGGVLPYFYDWQPGGGSSATATGLENGQYIVSISDQNNCVISDTVNMTQPDPVIALAIGDTAICPADTALIWAEATGGAGNYSYLWDNGIGLGQGADVSPVFTTDFVVVATDSAGCSSAPDTMTITIAPLPTPSFTYTSQDACSYPIQLDMTNTTVGGVDYEWFFGNGDISTDQDPSVIYDNPGNYTITLISYSDIGCVDTTSIVYEASEAPEASFSISDAEGCSPVVVSFSNNSENAFTFAWDFGDGTTSVLPDPTHVYDNPGEYEITLIVATSSGCADTLDLTSGVTVWPSPIADFDPVLTTDPIPSGSFYFDNLSSGATGYEWDFGNGESSNLFDPTHDYITNGGIDVILYATNEFGCIDTAMHYFEIDVFSGLFVPNAVAAGVTGEAGKFLPKGTGIEEYIAMVFDKWGNKLWESTALENGSPAEGWDGRFKGVFVPQGAYIWKIDALFQNGHVWEGVEVGRDKYRTTGSITVMY